MRSTGSTTKNRNHFSGFLEHRMMETEKSFNNLTKEFIAYARRTAKLRNDGDEISDILGNYISNQEHNDTSFKALNEFRTHISTVEDYRDVELENLKSHVIRPLINYTSQFKTLKMEIKKEVDARKKEEAHQKNFERNRNNENVFKKEKVKNDYHTATLRALEQSEKLSLNISKLEKEKLETMKKVMKSYVHIEMVWHLRALEHYTHAYNSLNNIYCDSDLEQLLASIESYEFLLSGTIKRSSSTNSLFNRPPEPMGTNLRRTQLASSHDNLRNKEGTIHASPRHSTLQQLPPSRPPPLDHTLNRNSVENGSPSIRLSPSNRKTTEATHTNENDSDEDNSDYTDESYTHTSSRTATQPTNPIPQPRRI